MNRVLLLVASLIVLACSAQAQIPDLPVDQLWSLNLGSPVTLGPIWADQGATHLLAGGGNRLREVVNGRIIITSQPLGGRITALDRGEVDQAEGVEVLVAVKGDTLSELLVLDGQSFAIISRLTLGNNPNTETTGLAWIAASATLAVIRSTYAYQNNDVIHLQETTRSARMTRINLQGEQFGEAIECGFGSIKRWRDEENNTAGFVIFGTRQVNSMAEGYRFEYKTFLLTTLNSAGRIQYATDIWSGGGDIADGSAKLGGTAIAPLQEGGFATFEAFMTTGFPPAMSHLYAHKTENLEQIALHTDLDVVPHSLAYLPPEESAEGLPFLLCAFEHGEIRLFDLGSFRFNPQEYSWEPSSNMLLTGDFDEDGRIEIFGLTGSLLTCARLRPLSAFEPDFILHPSSLILSSFPNPFNASTTITFSVGAYCNTPLQLAIYDLQGRMVADLVTGRNAYPPGEHRIVWDGSRLTNGQYILRLNGTTESLSRPVTIIK